MYPNTATTQEPDRVTGWLRPDRMLDRPRRWVVLLTVLTVVAYHFVWALTNRPYVSPALIALGTGLVLLVLLMLLTSVKGGVVKPQGVASYFMVAIGIGGTVLGCVLLASSRAAEPFDAAARELIGALALMAGVFVGTAGVFLRPPKTGLSRFVENHDFATESIQLSDGDGLLRRSRTAFGAGRIDRLVDACRSHVKADDLHYVALYVDDVCAFYLDAFPHHAVQVYFTDEQHEERRRDAYLQVAAYLRELLPDMNTAFEGIDSGILIRVVLDVERGAVYYYRIDSRRFLIGVTLNQSVVHKADSVMTRLTQEIQVLLGHRKNTDFND